MWNAYPNPGGPASAAKQTIGGYVDADWISNTCVVRVSRSFNYSGNRIPAQRDDEIATVKGGDGKAYAIRVREFTQGHVDLWNGEQPRHAEYFSVAKRVRLWEVPDTPAGPVLSASVGVGAANTSADVNAVQALLLEKGFDPGPVDGVVGRKTIAAMREFQRSFMRRPDGRIDTDGRSWRELLGQ